ncbi:hypothetical protein ACFL2Q_14115 [Thermodesulfobacteriota bacterium]
MFENIRQVGKYTTIGACFVAIGQSFAYGRPFGQDLIVAYICMLGLCLWVAGGFAVRYPKIRAFLGKKKS